MVKDRKTIKTNCIRPANMAHGNNQRWFDFPWNERVLLAADRDLFRYTGTGNLRKTLHQRLKTLLKECTKPPNLGEQISMIQQYDRTLSEIYGDKSADRTRISEGLRTIFDTETYLDNRRPEGTIDTSHPEPKYSLPNSPNGRPPFGGPIRKEKGRYSVGQVRFNINSLSGAIVGVLYQHGDAMVRDLEEIVIEGGYSPKGIVNTMSRLNVALEGSGWKLTSEMPVGERRVVAYVLDRCS